MSESREAARERAREIRAQHRKRDRRRRFGVVAAVIGGVVVAGLIVTFVLVSSLRPSTRGPQNMQSDGLKIGEGFAAVRTPALGVGDTPVASEPNPTDVVDIQIYYDYLCPNCGAFEERNGDQLREWIENNAATVEYHPIAIFTAKSAGTQYSLRAANAVACVAELSPDQFFDYHEALFADQPEENTPGFTDDELLAIAEEAGVEHLGNVEKCIDTQRFRVWVNEATQRALAGPIAGTEVASIASTPTIIVNGEEFKYTTAFDPNEFAQFVARAAGQSFSDNPTPTPTPTPTETPAP
ncbi:thioredoxin domain-containing protein [Pseudolysinimonas sp.]|uniref:DsbA family protein n=1 Tax=Pseudolysinimonas sp. TaxID=2680009 RepID=UPI00286A8CE5|nr:thioredoxin domain-containing protein [Pseudolysinimonas sp.]